MTYFPSWLILIAFLLHVHSSHKYLVALLAWAMNSKEGLIYFERGKKIIKISDLLPWVQWGTKSFLQTFCLLWSKWFRGQFHEERSRHCSFSAFEFFSVYWDLSFFSPVLSVVLRPLPRSLYSAPKWAEYKMKHRFFCIAKGFTTIDATPYSFNPTVWTESRDSRETSLPCVAK